MIRATFAGFNTALTALQSNQKRLDVTGQNLANMHTTGYTRQALQTSSLNYSGPVSHYMNGSEIQVGFGVAMDSVIQIRDPFLDAQYRYQMEKSGYTDALQTSFDSLSSFLDETSIKGIRDAFDDIRAVLTNLQDPSKVNDAVFESELRARMENLTNLLNDSARKIEEARAQEFQRLDGEGTNQNGAKQTVNDILERIGKLNRQIKYNQVFNQPSLELMDERNVLLDELASYVPIEVTYYKEEGHKDDLEWPDDLRVNMLYVGDDGKQHTLTLVDGTEGAEGQNVGKLEFLDSADKEASFPDSEPYLNIKAQFTAAETANQGFISIYGRDDTAGTSRLSGNGGSIQASLDMLAGTDVALAPDTNTTATIESANANVRNYQYYMNHLNNLAYGFGYIIDSINNLPDANGKKGGDLISNFEKASTIGINPDWAAGNVSFGKGIEADGNNANDTALAMLGAMSWRYSSTTADKYGIKYDLGGKTFADYMNNVSTTLATDSKNNQNALKTNVTVLNGIQDSRDALSGISLDEEAANMMTYMASYNAASRLMTTLDEALNTLINGTGLVGR